MKKNLILIIALVAIAAVAFLAVSNKNEAPVEETPATQEGQVMENTTSEVAAPAAEAAATAPAPATEAAPASETAAPKSSN